METREKIIVALEDIALGPECVGCPGLEDRSCPAARLVLKIEGIMDSAVERRVGTGYEYSGDTLLQSVEDFGSAVACCPGFGNVGHFAAKSVPLGNDGSRFHMIDLATEPMAIWADIDPPRVYLPMPSAPTCEEQAYDRAERRAIHA